MLARGIYSTDPRRVDKDELLTHGAVVLDGYDPVPPGDALRPFLNQISTARGQASLPKESGP
jgi:hypothetical protein